MSLYDQFYSNENITHMLHLLNSIIGNQLDKGSCTNLMDTVFQSTSKENIIDINKELLDETLRKYDITNIPDEILTRDTTLTSDTISNDTISNNITLTDNKDSKKDDIFVSSGNRLDGSRYIYTYQLRKPVTSIEKIIIPIENNIIFTNSLFVLKIPELNVNTLCNCTDIKKINNYKYGTYIPENKNIYSNHTHITINIENINIINDKIDDIIKIKEIDEDPECTTVGIIHECTKDNIFKNIKSHDHIKILNTNTYCKVVNKISSTEIVVDKSIKGESFINLNLQNTIIFN